MSRLRDRELADTLQRGRKRTAMEVVLDADRSDPRWERIRAACCPFTGLTMSLDEYADRVWLVVTGGRAT